MADPVPVPARPLRLPLALLSAALAGGTAVVLALVADGPLRDVPLAYAFPAVGALYGAAGLLAWWRRPANRLGALLVLACAAWLSASLANTGVRSLIAVGTVTAVLPISVLLHLLHASPGGRLRERTSRVAVAGAYAVGLLLQAPLWAFRPQPPPYDLLVVADRPDLALVGQRLQQVTGALVVLATVVVLVRRLREHPPAQRRVLAPLYGWGLLAVVAVPLVANVLTPLLGLGDVARAGLQLAATATVPLGFLAVVLRGGFARTGELSDFVTSVASSSGRRDELEEAVAATLGDPSARLLRWSTSQGAYVGADGAPVPLPGPGDRTAVAHVEVAGQPLGAVLHDAQLGTDPLAVAAVGRVAAIAVERERLAAEVLESRRALREASSRLLHDSDRDRRRVAQDLHDGLQVSLVRLSMQAHRLAQDPVNEETPTLAARLAVEVDDAAAALRSIVHGVMPAPLVERGLAAAVRELAYDLPLRARLDVDRLPGRLPGPVESTAYFVVAEALTNVLKHADATAVDVSLSLRDDVLSVEVSDDGRGGARADGNGTGLAGLRDRLDVLGGRLAVVSGGSGTRLEAELPCG